MEMSLELRGVCEIKAAYSIT